MRLKSLAIKIIIAKRLVFKFFELISLTFCKIMSFVFAINSGMSEQSDRNRKISRHFIVFLNCALFFEVQKFLTKIMHAAL